jgi:hypothetical protein
MAATSFRSDFTVRASNYWGGALALVALVLALLLCLQWPLRDWVQAHSRTANDLGQIVFALYMSVAITVASLGGAHLAAQSHLQSQHNTDVAFKSFNNKPSRTLFKLSDNARRWLYAACVLPWALYLLSTAFLPALHAVLRWERFPETSTAGYWLLHIAVCVLALGATLFALRSLFSSTMPLAEQEKP